VAVSFSSFSEYLQAVMSRFCVVVAIAVCCLVTSSYGGHPDSVPGRYTLVAGIPSVWYMYHVYQTDDRFTVCLVDVLGYRVSGRCTLLMTSLLSGRCTCLMTGLLYVWYLVYRMSCRYSWWQVYRIGWSVC